jgi:hypothetical protein
MKQYTLMLLVLLISLVGMSQDKLTSQDRKLMQAISINEEDYKAFAKVMKGIQQKILSVHKDSTMSFEEKKSILEKLHQEKEEYVNTHLSAEQQRLLKAYYKNNERHSAAYYRRKQQMDKLRQKG